MKNNRFAVAIHILALASNQPREYLTSEFIANSVNTNPVVIRRINSMLKKAGLLTSHPGIPGLSITKDPSDISLLAIYKAVQHTNELGFAVHEDPNPNCAVGSNIQSALEKKFKRAQQAMEEELARQTLDDVLQDLFD
ncbi:Rrf2 family transcriptional regulator [Virgibacillus dakarensis]|nr:Rrf2 family transcriptional regulator [Virgibacillus dakarensis]